MSRTPTRLSRIGLLVVAVLAATTADVRLRAQDRFLGKEDIVLLGLGLRVEPERQVVPKDIATIVSTFLNAPTPPPGQLLPFAPDAIVKGTLRGPGVGNGLDLRATPNTPFNIPPLGVAGVYTLEEIRLESGGQVLMRGTPESVTIEVIEKLLITQVTARALTAQEIRDKGIVFDKTNFQAYNFTAAFAVQDTPIQISFPVVLPTLQGAQDITLSRAGLGPMQIPTLPELKTIIPDTLRLQTQIPNLKVIGFTLKAPILNGQQLVVPPIPGIVVIPGDIGFLNQYFSVMLLVGNVAPAGSNLVVTDLTGDILLPSGNDTVVGSDDDPLRMAQTNGGESPRRHLVVQAGPDGKLGTADDIGSLEPGASGSAEYLVEGRREGTHVIEFNITGTLQGLPVGPVQVTGRAAGSVLVRNPSFTLAFTHPDTVAAGEHYLLDVTLINTSESVANFVSVNLFSRNIVGATLVGDASKQIETIPAGDSATVSFDLISRVTGRVTAATLDTEDKVQGRFSLKTAVGELGVPVSPDSLILPTEANGLPAEVRIAVLGLLGKAWAVATAPTAAFPRDVKRFSKQIVFDRAVQAAEAGMRISLHEPVPDSVAQLAMDFIGSDFGRLSSLYPKPGDLPFVQADVTAFDELRRRSIRGDTLGSAIGHVLVTAVATEGAAGFHRGFAERVSYRPAHLSVLVTSDGGPLPFTATLVDAQGRRIGGVDASGKVVKEIPFADIFPLESGGALAGQLLVLAAPDAGEFHLQFTSVSGVPATGSFTVSLVVPGGSGGLRQIVYSGLRGTSGIQSVFTPSHPYRVLLDLPMGGGNATALSPTLDAAIVAPAPHVLGVIQQAGKDILGCIAALDIEGVVDVATFGIPAGRVIAVLFSEEVTAESVQDRVAATEISRYAIGNNQIVGVALQPGRRVAFLALRDPIGPFVPRQITISGVINGLGRVMAPETTPIETTVTNDASVVSGQVLGADGLPVPFANVRLFVSNPCLGLVGISSKSTDADGRYSWDWVPNSQRNRITAVMPGRDESRSIDFTSQRNGQRLNVNVVFLGRGILKGRALSEDGTPLAGTIIKVTSLTDNSSYGATTDDSGRFTIGRIPVGNVLLEGVHLASNAKGSASELIPLSGASVVHDLTLFSLSFPTTLVKFGTMTGHVLRADGASPVSDVPVIAYYQNNTQPGVHCPQMSAECAVGVTRTDAAGRFEIAHISAGQIHLTTFDPLTFQQGSAVVALPADGTTDATLLLGQGLGTVNGTVLDASGTPVADARVGGGLSLTTTDSAGHFVLTDVPVGHLDIVAVSDQLAATGRSTIDIVQAGQTVNVTVVLSAAGTIAGTVFQFDGVTPVPNNRVYLFYAIEGADGPEINVVATATTDAGGRYTMEKVALRPEGYILSAFRADFSDGNVRPVVLKFNHQVFRGDIVFRGGGGHVTGHVLDANGTTPLLAAVGITGDRALIAAGLVGTGFQSVANYQIVNTDITTGSFAFNNVFVGGFTIAAAGQFSPDPISYEGRLAAPGATVNVDLRLQDTSQIQGTVFQPDGVTPAGRNVIVRYKSSAFKLVCATNGAIRIGNQFISPGTCADVPQGIQDETVITDDDGHYLLPLVTAGSFTLTAEDPATGKTAQTAGAIRPGQTGDFSIRLLGLSSLTINVRGSNSITPIPTARVEVRQVAFPKKTFVGQADGSGTLVLNGGDAFSEGDVVVLATDPSTGFAGRASGRVTRDGDNVTINVFLFNASGTALGTVFAPDGLTAVANAEVVISNCVEQPLFIGVGAAPCISGGPLAFAVTDGTGAYRQELIPLGSFRVDVFEAATARRGYASGRIDLDRQEVSVNVVESARGLVTGTLFAAGTLAPLKNWEVMLGQSSPGGRQLPSLQTTTGVDGTFSFPGVGVGSFRLFATTHPLRTGDPYGSAQVVAALTTEGEHVDVPMLVEVIEPHYGQVEGIVVNPNGTPADNVTIDLCPIANCSQFFAGGIHLATLSGPDGAFAFDHVIIGRFVITAKSQVSLNAITSEGQLLFEGDLARVTLPLVGLSQVSGSVVFANGQPAPYIQVNLLGYPTSGCTTNFGCQGFTDGNGEFTFPNLTAKTFYLRATDPVSGLNGVTTGALNPGDHPIVRVVLQATASVTGRVLFANGNPAPRVTAQLSQLGLFPPPADIFQISNLNGEFTFPAVPIGSFTLNLEDPLGPGIARRSMQTAGAIALGDITLDEAPASVATLAPHASAIGVPLQTDVRIVFSEPVDAGTINQSNIRLTSPTGTVLGTLQVMAGDTTAVFTPLAPLTEQTRYTLSVQGIRDRIGKTMPAPFIAGFTTVDLTPPEVAELAPGIDGNGMALASVVRIKYSEPINPVKFAGAAVTLTTSAALVPGRIDFILGNTTIVFTPTLPLDENTLYQVHLGAAVDLAGNAQPLGVSYSFRTLDRTPPQIESLSAAATVVENGLAQVVAGVGTAHDISVVDFYLNDQPAAASRTPPFTLSFQALSALGHPGDQIKISALATDTSGNRSVTPAVTLVTIVADAPPVISVTSPAPGAAFRTGERVTVTVHITDDLGVTQVGYRAQTGKPQDAGTQPVAPSGLDITRTFAFSIGDDAVPGSSIAINATAVDTKRQTANAIPVSVTVLDATPPVVAITGTTTGAKVSPGQQTSAIVSAQDLGGIASIVFTTGGVTVGTFTRTVAPAQPAVVTTFPFTVPASAHAGDTLTLDAVATDAAGNSTSAARILLPIADLNAPTLQLRTLTGSTDIVPGAVVNVIAESEDETGVATIVLTGQGAFSVSQAKQVSPISNSAQLTFQIPVPASAAEGAVLQLSANATDIFGNVSAPATVSLTVRSVVGVTLPPSLLIAAGEAAAIEVQLSSPAPAGGLTVDLRSGNTVVVQVVASVQFAEGDTTKPATVTAVSGGTVSVTASVNNVVRASTIVTVRGGIVSGTVFNPLFQPVAGARVTVIGATGLVRSTVSDGNGGYQVEGISAGFGSTAFSIRVSDPTTNQIGFAAGSLNVVDGFAHVNVVVITAGSIGGTVLTADGHTAAGVGARVDLFASNNLSQSLGTVFTDANGAYEFPIVSPGTYVVSASDVAGNRAQSAPVVIANSGQHVAADLVYLGRGIVAGTVRSGFGNAMANIPITLTSTSLFGQAPTIGTNSAQDGTFRFEGVFVGSFTVQARDPITNLVGSRSATIAADLQVVTVDISLAQWGGVQGTVFRADGLTPLASGTVSVSAAATNLTTTTDGTGHYAFTFLPLGTYTISVNEPGTHGIGRATGTLTVHALVVTQDVTLFAQGTLVVTVTDANSAPLPGAAVLVSSSTAQGGDSLAATTGANGVVVVEHVLASQNVSVLARANGLSGYVVTTLQPNEVRPVTVRLEPTGSIIGTVFLPDGQTPATDAKVGIFGVPVPVNADGTFRFDGLTLRSWEVTGYDAPGRKRALVQNVVLNQNGQIATVNLTLIGLGSVVGRVLNPDNSSAPNMSVLLHTLDPVFGSFYGATTNAAGFYSIDNVIVGALTVSTGDTIRGLLGEASGTIAHDGDTLTLDILMKNNAVNLPTTKSDGNFFPFDVQRDASIAKGLNGTFSGYYYYPEKGGAFFLDLVANGTPNRFTGSTIGTTEDNGREIVVTQNNLAGLNVTRKVLVSTSYFARYLEVLSNPTASPITVDVSVQASSHTYSVLKTSTGDATLGVSDPANPDRWVVLNTNQDTDPFVQYATAQVAFGFDGAGAARRASVATFAINPNSALGLLTYRWNDVTIQPGQTIAFMHFGVQQYSRAAAEASVVRLAQLPPEALESLTPAEIGEIQNFAVPTDGTSPLAALSPLGGTINGRVLEADETTAVSSISPYGGTYLNLRYRSNNVLFGRTYTGSTNASGNFTFGGSTVTVPRDAFTLEADHPMTSVTSTPTLGAFPTGSATATANIVFSNTGIVRGTVRRTSGLPVAGATLLVSSPTLYPRAYPVTGSDGSYFAAGIPPGPITVVAQIRHPQAYGSFSLKGTAVLTLTAGATEVRDLTIQPTGALTGTVRTALGAPSVNTTVLVSGVDPSDPQTALYTQTDSAGVYRFNDVPLGALIVTTTEPGTYFRVTGGVTVLQDQTSTRDLTLLAVGSVNLTVTYTNGLPADHAYVEIQEAALGLNFRNVPPGYYTDANGRMTIAGVPAGAFVVRVHRPDDHYTSVDVPGTLTTHAQVVPTTAVLPPFGTLVVQVNSRAGTPVANVRVDADLYGPNYFQNLGTTDVNGRLTVPQVKGPGTLTVRAYDPQNGQFRQATGAVTSEGQTLAMTITLNSAGLVSGRMTNADGSPAAGMSLVVLALGGNYGLAAQTDGDGHYEAADVPTGLFRVRMLDYTNKRFGSFEGELVHDGDAVVADFVLSKALLSYPGLPLVDANGSNYIVGENGAVSGSWPSDGFFGFPSLLVSPLAGGFNYFAGDYGAALEQNGRQVAVPNFNVVAPQPLAGLTVTRKVFVDPAGYFARYLEIFDNPTNASITVNVQLQGSLNASRLTDTSSGDAVLSSADTWFLTDHTGNAAAPRDVFVFEGANATLPVGAASGGSYGFGPTVQWNNLTVAAGGRAILMHFVSAEPDNAAARAAAERLAQAPAEALVGLTSSDFAAIRNFAVPADGSSSAQPFGTVTGRVLAGGLAPVPNARVLVGGSSSPIFKPTITVQADANGQYRASTLGVGPFTVQAQDPVTGDSTPLVSLALGVGETSVTQDLTFVNAGVLRGTVRFGTGAAVVGGQVTITGGTPLLTLVKPIAADGTFSAAPLKPGTYDVQAIAAGRSGSSAANVVTDGNTTVADVTLRAVAQVRVTLKRMGGAPLASAYLYLSDGTGLQYQAVTDTNGIALFHSVVEGPFSVRMYDTNEIFNTAILPVQDGQIVDFIVVSTAGSLTGTVRAIDGTPAASGYVQISPDGYNTVASSNIAADGSYAIDRVAPGTYTAFATVSGRTLQTAPFTVAAGEHAVLDIRLPGSSTLRVTLQPEGGAPIAGAYIYIDDGIGLRYRGTTDANGRVSIPDVREGTFSVTAYANGNVTLNMTKTGVIAAADNGRIVDFLLAPIVGNVTGHVFVADGVTPASGVSVLLLDAASGATVSYSSTDASGIYEIANIGTTDGTFRVVAHSPANYTTTVEAAGSFAGTPNVVIDLTLPIGVVRGTVFYADGVTPVSGAPIRLAQETAGGDTITSYRTSDNTGAFSVAGVVQGPFEILAMDPGAAVSGRASGTVADITVAVTANVSLEPAGIVTGTVHDSAANPIALVRVALDSDDPSVTSQYVVTDANGVFTFARVPVGGFSVQACDDRVSIVCGAVAGSVASTGQTVTSDITIEAVGSVSGTVFAADGTTPVPNASVYIVAGAERAGSGYTAYFAADANGHYTRSRVPSGLVAVATLDLNTYQWIGGSHSRLAAGGALVIDVRQGTAISACVQSLSGDDSFVYDTRCSGELIRGGTTDQRLTNAYNQDAYTLRLNGSHGSNQAAARLEMDGRQVVYGPFALSGVEAERKLFVPATGGFARFLDTVTNSSNAPVTLTVQSAGSLGGAVHVIVNPAATGNTYAVTLADRESGPITPPALAHVFAGPGAATPVSRVRFQTLIGPSSYEWRVTIAAGASVTLMHFAVQREPNDTAGAVAQALALANLADPNALAGMTTEEKARVVNFTIP